jgi:hypothetical protein
MISAIAFKRMSDVIGAAFHEVIQGDDGVTVVVPIVRLIDVVYGGNG